MKKFCTKCGKPFESVGREVICPACKAQAAEETKRAAVLRAKRASWTGESVPVRISGRASTVIRTYAAEKGLPFAQALDNLLKTTNYIKGVGVWEEIEPYRSRRRDKHATETAQDVPQEVKAAGKPQDVQDAPQDAASKPQNKPVKQAAKQASKATASKAKASKTAAGKE